MSMDYKSPVNELNEKLMQTSLMNEIRKQYQKVSLVDFDEQMNELGQRDTKDKYNLGNLIQLQIDEKKILKKNLDFVTKSFKDFEGK